MHNKIVLALLLSALTLIGAVGWKLQTLDATVAAYLRQKEQEMQTATTSWVSDGATVSVSTTRNDGESLSAWRTRHSEAVAAMQAEFPPDE